MKHLSVIIPAHNRASYLSKSIESVLNQSLDRDSYEIMVVDNASSDNTEEVVSSFSEQGVRYVFEERLGLSYARNTGIESASGRYVAFLDDDAVADASWLESIVNFFRDFPEAGAVGGKVFPIYEKEKPKWLSKDLEIYYSVCLLYTSPSPRDPL